MGPLPAPEGPYSPLRALTHLKMEVSFIMEDIERGYLSLL